jgi:hypothetical protein
MAVELCKVSLWINASVRDRPLSFLDHHIQCGNSLIGAAPELMAEGVPYEAFNHTLVGNHRERAKEIRKRNRQERRDFEKGGGVQMALFQVTAVLETMDDLLQWSELNRLAEERPQAARERYEAYRADEKTARARLIADTWTAAFFWPVTEDAPPPPTFDTFRRVQAQGKAALSEPQQRVVAALAERYRFFHWHLAFRDVFKDEGEGGFDVVLGNPPWERIKLQEKEFFADKDADIAKASTAAARRRLIKKLPQTDPELHAAYTAALRESEATSHFLRESGRYPLTSGGDINTYAVFAGLVRKITRATGRSGLILPLGIATDYTYRDFFGDVVGSGQLVSFYDFENRKGIFPGVHRNYNFALTTLAGSALPQNEAEFVFFMTWFEDLRDENRCFTLTTEDLQRINPNTRTLPVFRTNQEAELTRKIYQRCPVLHNQQTRENPWEVDFFTMFHMANDSRLFHTQEEMLSEGLLPIGNLFCSKSEVYLPLYEAKMMHQFNHRHGTFEGQSEKELRKGLCREITKQELSDETHLPMPRYWTAEHTLDEAIADDQIRKWFIGFRNITRAVDRRTATFAILPWAASGHSIQFVSSAIHENILIPSLLGNLNSLVFDFVVRQKMGGINLSYYIVRQLPVLPPDRYTPRLLGFIVPRVVELTYTAWDLQPFAQDVLDEVGEETWARWFADAPIHDSPPPAWTAGDTPAPFVWDEERRAVLRAELDALYAHLYGLTRDELAYILDTFPIVKRKDEAEYGEYRTKRMILEKYEEVEPLAR